ncbi:unnamed protein product [Rhodiola kirilowii]
MQFLRRKGKPRFMRKAQETDEVIVLFPLFNQQSARPTIKVDLRGQIFSCQFFQRPKTKSILHW